ncbi:alkaline phosphatase D family protein [Aquabacterium sp. A7-Y]|uniref:alkaline phosphatase D family protein n=1 Tax=Aquabacterium sp. A7-Y TaxID=1349605 RepID=UPI00223DE5EF|nr:alkaline phosphatase D family protein [Aquabacterium sp. A7-Y]MCW7538329.1 alkaline phosphatase D family protein [Aquabacterium sp. A7-Y]
MKKTFERRALLAHLSRSAAALALCSLFGSSPGQRPVPTPLAPRFDNYPFTLGVASGMPRPASVVLWTRLAPRPLDQGGGLPPRPLVVRWELADDENFGRLVTSGEQLALPEHGHSVHVQVEGLESGRMFFYRFLCGDAVSPIGRTRTAPAEDAPVQRLRFALASCQHYEQGHYAAHREIASRDLDFVLFVGDYIYESSHPSFMVRRHEGPPPTRLEAFRRRHATYKLDHDLRAAHAAHPWILTWDDHEVENDYAGEHSRFGGDPQHFLRRRAAAYKAYFEHLPIAPERAPVGPAMRIHDRYSWGRLAELWTLDGRQYRSPQACPEDGPVRGGRVLTDCAAMAEVGRSVFGTEQEQWLESGLHTSTRTWKLLAQASQLSSWGVDTPLGRSVYSDAWDGYPAARERLLRGMADAGLRDVIALGGDVHRHVAAQLRLASNDPASPIVASEFVTSSITSRGLPGVATALIRAANPDLLHARGDERGYAMIDLRPQQARCEFRATAFPVAEQARLHTQAAFVVESGRAGVQRDV